MNEEQGFSLCFSVNGGNTSHKKIEHPNQLFNQL